MAEQIRNRIAEINQRKVPEGYKKTPLGVIPEEWEDKTLSDIGDFYKGKGIPGNELQDDGVPCIGYGDIYMKYNYHFEKAVNFVDQKTANESQPIQKGTLLFTGSGETAEEIGKCVCYNGDEIIYAGGDIILYNSDVNPLFISYQQSIEPSVKTKAKLAQGHSVVHIYADRLGKLPVAYPKNKQEQQKIAEILMKWDEAIALQEKLIEKLELQKRALIQRLLTPKGNWISTTLDKVLKSGSKTAVADTSKYQKITIKLDLKGLEFTEVKREMADTRPFYVRKKGEIIIGKQNYFNGSIAIVSDEFDGCICSNAIMSFNVINSDVFYVFNYISQPNFLRKYENLANGTGQKELSEKDFLSFELKLPSIEHQRYISKIIGTSVSHLSLQIKKLNEMKLQQRSLMQLLLTGIVRVSE